MPLALTATAKSGLDAVPLGGCQVWIVPVSAQLRVGAESAKVRATSVRARTLASVLRVVSAL
ncbi:hypothetical protein AWU67_16595 [Microterricola viridarii]|uniref:Uncharacterized protein n=1 Tax=Microterricola viridarii TaxID=412690 RepID=A0A0Y0Q285_9MICO|nr:hypothetical protein AWU67_16595 [Microterricola viridarii]